MRLVGHEPVLPDPFEARRDEEAIARRMAEIWNQVNGLLESGREVCTVDEVRARHEAETKRMWLPKGEREQGCTWTARRRAGRSSEHWA